MTSVYSCSKCDAQSSKWSGRCLECGAWGTMKESVVAPQAKKKGAGIGVSSAPARLSTLDELAGSQVQRTKADHFPASRMFHEGIVAGSMTLLAGEPGAGKSTLSLQLAQNFSTDAKVLYCSAEESASQLKERSDRLGVFGKNFFIIESTNVEEIVSTIIAHKPNIVIVDSLQAIVSEAADADPGSVNQVRMVTAILSQVAKSNGVAVIAIGHVTKDGSVAGPKALEHLVDAVYYLESDKHSAYRLLRCFKNRYGATDTVLVMQMAKSGMHEVKDAATIFIADYAPKAGSVLTLAEIDDQFFFIEVQALVTKSGFGYAKRTSSGFSKSRLELLLAIMKKHLHVDCDAYDVYINIAGGFRVNEPALDLAVVLAVISSLKESLVPDKTIVFGEVGLSGELRIVRNTSARLKQVTAHAFKQVILPPIGQDVRSSMHMMQATSLPELMKKMKW